MSEPSPQSTIVPPYLNDQWRRLRGHLRASAELMTHAAEASTLEETKKFLGLASNQMMDASFWLAHIERDTANDPLEGIES
jgi:hypothetical protein